MELQIFQNAEFGSVRSTMINGEPFFVGKDVAEISFGSRKCSTETAAYRDAAEGKLLRCGS